MTTTNVYGRQVVVPLTNKSGGSVAAGDVVIIDTTNNDAFTTTTSASSTAVVGVAQETIANNATGRVLTHGYAALINVPSSVTRGHYCFTHTVAKQATGSASRAAGAFGQFLTGGTTPDAHIFGITDNSVSGLSDPMTTRGDTIYRNSSNVTARLAVGSAGKILSSDGTDVSWGNGPMTTKGDLIVGGTSGAPARLAVGTDTYVLTADSAQTNGVKWAAGSGSSRHYIDTLTLHATYGDDFTGSLDTGKWTRRTVTSGEETANVGSSDGWMAVDFSSGAASRLYLQTAPAGDFEIILSYMQHASATGHMTGPVIIDSTGAGVAAFPYNSAVAFYLGVMSAYAYSSFPTTIFYAPTGAEANTQRHWVGLKKSGTNYSVRYSLNGEVWSPYSSTSSQSFTVDRIGFGRILGTPTTHRMTVDRFNVI